MPNIRDLGISSIPMAARPAETGDGGVRRFDGPTSPELCGCNPTNDGDCNPTNAPGCNPTNDTGCNPTNQPGCNPTNQPGCNPTNQPGCNPTNKQTQGATESQEYLTMPPEVIAQLKQQLHQHISTMRN